MAFHTDLELAVRHGVIVAFSEREGGVSAPPFASLDLAAHTGDDPDAVDVNRTRLLAVLGLESMRNRLTMAEQVHGERIATVTDAEAGAGARAADGPGPLPATDALLTSEVSTPLLLCFADCVPVVLVAVAPVRAVAVVHAGWRGSLARLPGLAADALAAHAGCSTSALLAYVGPHVCASCYPVDDERLSQFATSFDTILPAQGRLDLGAVVSESLRDAGVPDARQARLDLCTAERTEAFFSYRAEGLTGRHGALAVVLEEEDETHKAAPPHAGSSARRARPLTDGMPR